MSKVTVGVLIFVVMPFVVFGCAAMVGVGSYNSLVSLSEGVDSQWAQVENVYQRRYDLIPNLVATVKGYAEHEKTTFTAVTEARARVGQVSVNSGSLTPESFQQFQAAQDGLTQALSRLLVVMERYPDLKANQNFISLQDELAGTENRISGERKKFNEISRGYNIKRRSFPTVLFASMLGFFEKPYFESVEGSDRAPEVDFSAR